MKNNRKNRKKLKMKLRDELNFTELRQRKLLRVKTQNMVNDFLDYLIKYTEERNDDLKSFRVRILNDVISMAADMKIISQDEFDKLMENQGFVMAVDNMKRLIRLHERQS